MTCNADDIAKGILTNITAGTDFTLPEIDLTDPKWDMPESLDAALKEAIEPLSIEQLTEKKVNGTGAIDVIMSCVSAHLKDEFERGRLTGAEYSKAYVALTTAAMQTGLQFLMQRDQIKWAGITAQIQAMTAKLGLETAKAQYIAAKAAAMTAEAQYANQVMDLAIKDAAYCTQQEQHEAARAQTMDTRSDGTVVRGSIGKQKELYSQQITSYQRSAETNAAKIFSDAWIAHKSIDEGIDAPAAFNAATISSVLTAIKTNNGL